MALKHRAIWNTCQGFLTVSVYKVNAWSMLGWCDPVRSNSSPTAYFLPFTRGALVPRTAVNFTTAGDGMRLRPCRRVSRGRMLRVAVRTFFKLFPDLWWHWTNCRALRFLGLDSQVSVSERQIMCVINLTRVHKQIAAMRHKFCSCNMKSLKPP